jgi:hypothetical protein
MKENPIQYAFLCKERKDFLFRVEFYADRFEIYSPVTLGLILDINIHNSQIRCKKCDQNISCKKKVSDIELKNLEVFLWIESNHKELNESYSSHVLNNLTTLLKCLEDHLIMFRGDLTTIEKLLLPYTEPSTIKNLPSEVDKIFKRVELMRIKAKLNQISNNF